MMTFAVGEKVVYPNQGVGTIENISTRFFSQKPEKFYLLRLICSSMTVMVPFATAQTIGLRKLSRNGDVSKVLAYLSGPDIESLSDWKVRFRINSDKMLTGSLLQIAEVFKQLVRLQAEIEREQAVRIMCGVRGRQLVEDGVDVGSSVADLHRFTPLSGAPRRGAFNGSSEGCRNRGASFDTGAQYF